MDMASKLFTFTFTSVELACAPDTSVATARSTEVLHQYEAPNPAALNIKEAHLTRDLDYLSCRDANLPVPVQSWGRY